jgi:hypothetical protein
MNVFIDRTAERFVNICLRRLTVTGFGSFSGMQTVAHLNKFLVRLIRKNSQYNIPTFEPALHFHN